MIKLGHDVTQFLVEYVEEIIFKLKDRKEKFESKEDIIKIRKQKKEYIC